MYNNKQLLQAQAEGCNILRQTLKRYPSLDDNVMETGGYLTEDTAQLGIWNSYKYTDDDSEKAIHTFNEYMDKMNRHAPKGYHFTYSGVTEGKIYIVKDPKYEADDTFTTNGVGDYDIATEAAYQDYLYHRADIDRKFKTMVQEALVLSNRHLVTEDMKLKELYRIHEADGNFISDAFTKMKNFFAKLWQKFNEFISRVTGFNKSYLEKYKHIILNKECILKPVTVDADYKIGVKNISNFTVQVPNGQEIHAMGTDDNATEQLRKKMLPAYGQAPKVEFQDYCKSFFLGDVRATNQSVEWVANAIPMSDLYNYCYNFDKIEKQIDKQRNIMLNELRAFQDAINTAQSEQKSQNPPATGQGTPAAGGPQTPPGNGKTQTPPATGQGTPAAGGPQTPPGNGKTQTPPATGQGTPTGQQSAAFITTLGIPIMEKVTGGNGVDDSRTGGSTSTTGTNNANAFGNATNKEGFVRKRAGDQGANNAGNNMDDIDKKFSIYMEVSRCIFAGMLSAAQQINKDYMSIIKLHVQSYAGNMNDSTNNPASKANNFYESKFKIDDALKQLDTWDADFKKAQGIQDEKQKEEAIAKLANTISEFSKNNVGEGNQIQLKNEQDIQNTIDALMQIRKDREEAAKAQQNQQQGK